VSQKHSDKDLTCQYRRHHPIFYINPLREEVLNANPRIVVYHNAVTDKEIERVREMATPRVIVSFFKYFVNEFCNLLSTHVRTVNS
jgi:hypothetical protein